MTGDSDAEFDDKRRVILDKARERFLREGFNRAAMGQIARAAQVSTATLYIHFPSKSELFHHMILDTAEEFVGIMRAVRFDSGLPCERVRAFTRGYAQFLSDPFVRAVLRLIAAERNRIPQAARDVYERGKREVGAPLIAALEDLTAEGGLSVPDPAWAAGQLMGMIEHPLFMSAMMMGDTHELSRDVDQIADDAVQTFLARYAPSHPTANKRGAVDNGSGIEPGTAPPTVGSGEL
ncbi:MAG: TetR/AcrR family transcriptional regulator [Caulobacterales bacterium]|nr:TetR/AcrR family transcriptional regulator [Caulobacterales bacterium]